MKKSILFAALCCATMLFAACEKSEPQNNEQDQTEELENKNDSINTSDDKNDITISGTIDGHDYVDLGLPSGTKWATCNIGATKPEDCGDYYAWGEVTTKTLYCWSNYKYANGYYALIKYCYESGYGNNGFTDELTTLEAADDAAIQNWGGNWRMPTIDEWEELRDYCDYTWTTRNNVNGCEIKAKNGNFIFLPAAGYHSYKEYDMGTYDYLYYMGTEGDYWSKSLGYCNSSAEAEYLEFNDYSAITPAAGMSRHSGLSIRPVCK